MIPVHNLFVVIQDLLYSRYSHVDIILPYWNKKKEVGPLLANLLKTAGLHRVKSTPEEWQVMTEKGVRYINFTTSLEGHGYANIVIIPDDK